MTYVLSVRSSSPFKDMYTTTTSPLDRSCSSIGSVHSSCTVQHNKIRSFSSNSLSSISSILGSPFHPRLPDENAHGRPRAVSSFNLGLLTRGRPSSRRRSGSTNADSSRRTSFSSVLSHPRLHSDPGPGTEMNEMRLVNVEESEDESASPPACESDDTIHALEDTISLPESLAASPEPKAFRRWVSTLRRKKPRQPESTTVRDARWELDDFNIRAPSPEMPTPSSRAGSRSSSLRFVTAVKSATVTIASASIAGISRQNSKWRHGRQQSVASGSAPRSSVDTRRSSMDKASKQRSRKRREKLEELIRTEESYVADVKALSNAYFTLLGHHQTSASFARASAQRTIASLLHLHDDILGQLHQVVPFAEYDQSVAKIPRPAMERAHTRWHSVDIVPRLDTPARSKLTSIRQARRSLNISRSSDEEQVALRCSPQVIAAVAKTFSTYMSRFQAYEEFGANYELVQRDIDEAQRSIVAWQDYDRAIEAISSTINPVKSREANRKKAMTVKDLLIKPIQRLPRYELLFNDLCKLTPVCDDPESHAMIELLLEQLNQTCRRMNLAKESPTRSRMLEATWLIGDRLSFSGQVPQSVYLQLLGPVVLCGCLHIAYRSKDRIRGFYAICVLFESTLLIASADEEQPKYSVMAGIALANATIEETDNGKGLQCHTAPHSWKVVFEHSARMYEVIFTACSAPEATVWRQNVAKRVEVQAQAVAKGIENPFQLQSPLVSEMRSVGKAFGKPGSFVRRMSVHRTATVGPTTDLNQVVIKNTQAVKEALDNSSHTSLQIPRSQSVFTPAHIQQLAPRRADRTRLEALLGDVWTKDLLPYPGMTRRSDPLRASANHVIRKFSMASITSNFSSSKRTASYTSMHQPRNNNKEEMPPPPPPPPPPQQQKLFKSSIREQGQAPSRPPLVDFHNAPEAFLPADFELHDPARKKRSALRTFTLNMERPFSPLLGNGRDNVSASGLRRAQSVCDVTADPASMLPPQADGKMKSTATLPVYSVPQQQEHHSRAPSRLQEESGTGTGAGGGEMIKIPRKSKSKNKLMRLFG